MIVHAILRIEINRALNESAGRLLRAATQPRRSQHSMLDHHRPASERLLMAFRWRAGDGPTLNTGLVALRSRPVFLDNPFFFFFWGGGASPSGSAHDVTPIVYVGFVLDPCFTIPSLMYFLGIMQSFC